MALRGVSLSLETASGRRGGGVDDSGLGGFVRVLIRSACRLAEDMLTD